MAKGCKLFQQFTVC
jgi:hypothetical protein